MFLFLSVSCMKKYTGIHFNTCNSFLNYFVWSPGWKWTGFIWKLESNSQCHLNLKCWVMVFAMTVSGCIGPVAPFMSAGFKASSLLIFRPMRRPVISDSLGRLICSLIDGLSVWSNYPRADREAGDFTGCEVHTDRCRHKNSHIQRSFKRFSKAPVPFLKWQNKVCFLLAYTKKWFQGSFSKESGQSSCVKLSWTQSGTIFSLFNWRLTFWFISLVEISLDDKKRFDPNL